MSTNNDVVYVVVTELNGYKNLSYPFCFKGLPDAEQHKFAIEKLDRYDAVYIISLILK